MKSARGFTLIELLVALAIVASISLVAALSMRNSLDDSPVAISTAKLEAARTRAITSRQPIVVVLDSAEQAEAVLFLPDGRAIGPRASPLTGRVDGRR